MCGLPPRPRLIGSFLKTNFGLTESSGAGTKNHSPCRTNASLRRRRRFLVRLTLRPTAARTSDGCRASIAEITLDTDAPGTAQTNQCRSFVTAKKLLLAIVSSGHQE